MLFFKETEKSEKDNTIKKLDPEELKKKLGKCSNLKELRSRLLKSSSSNLEAKIEQFKSLSAVRNAKLGVVNSGSPQKLCSPVKSHSPAKVLSAKKGSLTPLKGKSPHPQLDHFKSLEVEVDVT